jgi:hypothetical protein
LGEKSDLIKTDTLVFAKTYGALRRRIAAFVELPLKSLSRMALQSHVDHIGSTADLDAKG